MTRVTRFSLQRHSPVKSRLLVDGEPSRTKVPGLQLRDQLETAHGYVLVTDYDCPFEEATNFILLGKDLRVLSCRCLGGCYDSFLLTEIEPIDDHNFTAVLAGGQRWRCTVRPGGALRFRPRLKLERTYEAGGGPPPAGASTAVETSAPGSPAPALLRFQRPAQYADCLRSYQLLVDGVRRATIRRGRTVEVPVAPGRHCVVARIDWCSSNELLLDCREGQIHRLVVGSNLKVSRLWRAPPILWSLIALPSGYLFLRELDPTADLLPCR